METVRISTSQNIEIDYPVAGLGSRIRAAVIDYAIFFGLYLLCVFGFLGLQARTGNQIAYIVAIAIWMAFYVFYDLVCEIFFNGQSIGKRITKIKVVSLNGARPTVGQYLLRWMFRIVDFGITGWSAGIVFVAVSDKKQRIGDIVAGTAVIKTELPTKFKDLVFSEPDEDYQVVYPQVIQLTDGDIALINDVIRNFNRTRKSMLIYRLAMRVKDYLKVSYPPEINEYQFLEIIANDYASLTSRGER